MTASTSHSDSRTPTERILATNADLVVAVDVALCALTLPHSVRLGTAKYSEREYVVVRVTDTEGRHGFAYGYTRGVPLLPMLEKASKVVIGTDPRNRVETVSAITSASPSVRSTMVRATSLIEIALWDLLGKQTSLSLSQMLGVARKHVPVLPVAGYFRDIRGDDSVVDELVKLEKDGFSQIKLMVGALDTPATLAFLKRSRDALSASTRLAVDAHYSLESVEVTRRTMRALADIGIWMLEDPFLPAEWRKLTSLSQAVGPGIAVGEDVSEPAQFVDLLEHAAILRVDPTTCGGIRAAISGIEAAAFRGVPVIPHVFTQLAAQLAGAFTTVTCVEHIPPTAQADPIDQFFERPLVIMDGQLAIDTAPGAGVSLNWDALQRHTTATATAGM